PSGKRARQQRQAAVAAPPPVRSTGAGGVRQASPKVLGIAGGVLIVVIVAIVLAVVLSRNNSSSNSSYQGERETPTVTMAGIPPAVGSSTKSNALGGPLPGAADVATMLKDIPQKGFVLGNPKAPVQLTEFIDLQCPACQQFETTQLGPLIDKYVRTGKM